MAVKINQSDPRAHRSRTLLMEAGIEVLSQNIDASLSDIAATAGVGRATLYRHFETREELILALGKESLDQTDQACAHIIENGIAGREAIEAIFCAVLPLGNRFHFLLLMWQQLSGDNSHPGNLPTTTATTRNTY